MGYAEDQETIREVQAKCDAVYRQYAGFSLDTVVWAFKQVGITGDTEDDLRRFAEPISRGERLVL